MNHQDQLDRFLHFFEHVSTQNVVALTELYSADAYFKDPFNEVRGHAAIIAIFEHMFKKTDEPKFQITRSILQGNDAFIVWDFNFRVKGSTKIIHIHGSSHLCFAPDHSVNYHRDYWDAAEDLYEKIPVLGSLMRYLKRSARS
jgi:predicted SnoaL-like aldol condensation-catalyzing enzyme